MISNRKILIVVGIEGIIFYFTFRYVDIVPLDTIAGILSTLFALVFLLPQIIGQFVMQPHPQNLYELYPKKLYIIAFIFVLGIVFSVSGISFEFRELPFDLSMSANNIAFFIFLNSLGLLVLHFNNTLASLSFDHNFRTLKAKYISLIKLSQKENKGWIQSFEKNCRYAIRNIYGLIDLNLQSNIEKNLESHKKKISTIIESIHTMDECFIPKCIRNIFQIIESLLRNNMLKSYNELLNNIIKASLISKSFALKKRIIEELSNINSNILTDDRYKENRNELIKKNIKEIANIGSSNPNFNRDVLIIETQEKIKKIFDKCLEREFDEFDYTVFVYNLEKLLKKAFENNIKYVIRENIRIFYHIIVSFKDTNLNTNPTEITIEKMRDIGIKCAKKRWENLLFNYFNTILYLKAELPKKYHLKLSSHALIIASQCNKYLPEILPKIENILKNEIENLERIKIHALNYTYNYSQIQYTILKEYLKNF